MHVHVGQLVSHVAWRWKGLAMETHTNYTVCVTKKDGHNRKRKKRRNQTQKGTPIEVIAVDGIPVCTWVPKANLHIDIVHALKDGVASGGRLSWIKPNSRAIRFPKRAHPLTMWVKTPSANAVTNFFTPTTPSPSVLNKKFSVRICNEDHSGDIKIQTPLAKIPPLKKSKQQYDLSVGFPKLVSRTTWTGV